MLSGVQYVLSRHLVLALVVLFNLHSFLLSGSSSSSVHLWCASAQTFNGTDGVVVVKNQEFNDIASFVSSTGVWSSIVIENVTFGPRGGISVASPLRDGSFVATNVRMHVRSIPDGHHNANNGALTNIRIGSSTNSSIELRDCSLGNSVCQLLGFDTQLSVGSGSNTSISIVNSSLINTCGNATTTGNTVPGSALFLLQMPTSLTIEDTTIVVNSTGAQDRSAAAVHVFAQSTAHTWSRVWTLSNVTMRVSADVEPAALRIDGGVTVPAAADDEGTQSLSTAAAGLHVANCTVNVTKSRYSPSDHNFGVEVAAFSLGTGKEVDVNSAHGMPFAVRFEQTSVALENVSSLVSLNVSTGLRSSTSSLGSKVSVSLHSTTVTSSVANMFDDGTLRSNMTSTGVRVHVDDAAGDAAVPTAAVSVELVDTIMELRALNVRGVQVTAENRSVVAAVEMRDSTVMTHGLPGGWVRTAGAVAISRVVLGRVNVSGSLLSVQDQSRFHRSADSGAMALMLEDCSTTPTTGGARSLFSVSDTIVAVAASHKAAVGVVLRMTDFVDTDIMFHSVSLAPLIGWATTDSTGCNDGGGHFDVALRLYRTTLSASSQLRVTGNTTMRVFSNCDGQATAGLAIMRTTVAATAAVHIAFPRTIERLGTATPVASRFMGGVNSWAFKYIGTQSWIFNHMTLMVRLPAVVGLRAAPGLMSGIFFGTDSTVAGTNVLVDAGGVYLRAVFVGGWRQDVVQWQAAVATSELSLAPGANVTFDAGHVASLGVYGSGADTSLLDGLFLTTFYIFGDMHLQQGVALQLVGSALHTSLEVAPFRVRPASAVVIEYPETLILNGTAATLSLRGVSWDRDAVDPVSGQTAPSWQHFTLINGSRAFATRNDNTHIAVAVEDIRVQDTIGNVTTALAVLGTERVGHVNVTVSWAVSNSTFNTSTHVAISNGSVAHPRVALVSTPRNASTSALTNAERPWVETAYSFVDCAVAMAVSYAADHQDESAEASQFVAVVGDLRPTDLALRSTTVQINNTIAGNTSLVAGGATSVPSTRLDTSVTISGCTITLWAPQSDSASLFAAMDPAVLPPIDGSHHLAITDSNVSVKAPLARFVTVFGTYSNSTMSVLRSKVAVEARDTAFGLRCINRGQAVDPATGSLLPNATTKFTYVVADSTIDVAVRPTSQTQSLSRRDPVGATAFGFAGTFRVPSYENATILRSVVSTQTRTESANLMPFMSTILSTFDTGHPNPGDQSTVSYINLGVQTVNVQDSRLTSRCAARRCTARTADVNRGRLSGMMANNTMNTAAIDSSRDSESSAHAACLLLFGVIDGFTLRGNRLGATGTISAGGVAAFGRVDYDDPTESPNLGPFVAERNVVIAVAGRNTRETLTPTVFGFRLISRPANVRSGPVELKKNIVRLSQAQQGPRPRTSFASPVAVDLRTTNLTSDFEPHQPPSLTISGFDRDWVECQATLGDIGSWFLLPQARSVNAGSPIKLELLFAPCTAETPEVVALSDCSAPRVLNAMGTAANGHIEFAVDNVSSRLHQHFAPACVAADVPPNTFAAVNISGVRNVTAAEFDLDVTATIELPPTLNGSSFSMVAVDMSETSGPNLGRVSLSGVWNISAQYNSTAARQLNTTAAAVDVSLVRVRDSSMPRAVIEADTVEATLSMPLSLINITTADTVHARSFWLSNTSFSGISMEHSRIRFLPVDGARVAPGRFTFASVELSSAQTTSPTNTPSLFAMRNVSIHVLTEHPSSVLTQEGTRVPTAPFGLRRVLLEGVHIDLQTAGPALRASSDRNCHAISTWYARAVFVAASTIQLGECDASSLNAAVFVDPRPANLTILDSRVSITGNSTTVALYDSNMQTSTVLNPTAGELAEVVPVVMLENLTAIVKAYGTSAAALNFRPETAHIFPIGGHVYINSSRVNVDIGEGDDYGVLIDASVNISVHIHDNILSCVGAYVCHGVRLRSFEPLGTVAPDQEVNVSNNGATISCTRADTEDYTPTSTFLFFDGNAGAWLGTSRMSILRNTVRMFLPSLTPGHVGIYAPQVRFLHFYNFENQGNFTAEMHVVGNTIRLRCSLCTARGVHLFSSRTRGCIANNTLDMRMTSSATIYSSFIGLHLRADFEGFLVAGNRVAMSGASSLRLVNLRPGPFYSTQATNSTRLSVVVEQNVLLGMLESALDASAREVPHSSIGVDVRLFSRSWPLDAIVRDNVLRLLHNTTATVGSASLFTARSRVVSGHDDQVSSLSFASPTNTRVASLPLLVDALASVRSWASFPFSRAPWLEDFAAPVTDTNPASHLFSQSIETDVLYGQPRDFSDNETLQYRVHLNGPMRLTTLGRPNVSEGMLSRRVAVVRYIASDADVALTLQHCEIVLDMTRGTEDVDLNASVLGVYNFAELHANISIDNSSIAVIGPRRLAAPNTTDDPWPIHRYSFVDVDSQSSLTGSLHLLNGSSVSFGALPSPVIDSTSLQKANATLDLSTMWDEGLRELIISHSALRASTLQGASGLRLERGAPVGDNGTHDYRNLVVEHSTIEVIADGGMDGSLLSFGSSDSPSISATVVNNSLCVLVAKSNLLGLVALRCGSPSSSSDAPGWSAVPNITVKDNNMTLAVDDFGQSSDSSPQTSFAVSFDAATTAVADVVVQSNRVDARVRSVGQFSVVATSAATFRGDVGAFLRQRFSQQQRTTFDAASSSRWCLATLTRDAVNNWPLDSDAVPFLATLSHRFDASQHATVCRLARANRSECPVISALSQTPVPGQHLANVTAAERLAVLYDLWQRQAGDVDGHGRCDLWPSPARASDVNAGRLVVSGNVVVLAAPPTESSMDFNVALLKLAAVNVTAEAGAIIDVSNNSLTVTSTALQSTADTMVSLVRLPVTQHVVIADQSSFVMRMNRITYASGGADVVPAFVQQQIPNVAVLRASQLWVADNSFTVASSFPCRLTVIAMLSMSTFEMHTSSAFRVEGNELTALSIAAGASTNSSRRVQLWASNGAMVSLPRFRVLGVALTSPAVLPWPDDFVPRGTPLIVVSRNSFDAPLAAIAMDSSNRNFFVRMVFISSFATMRTEASWNPDPAVLTCNGNRIALSVHAILRSQQQIVNYYVQSRLAYVWSTDADGNSTGTTVMFTENNVTLNVTDDNASRDVNTTSRLRLYAMGMHAGSWLPVGAVSRKNVAYNHISLQSSSCWAATANGFHDFVYIQSGGRSPSFVSLRDTVASKVSPLDQSFMYFMLLRSMRETTNQTVRAVTSIGLFDGSMDGTGNATILRIQRRRSMSRHLVLGALANFYVTGATLPHTFTLFEPLHLRGTLLHPYDVEMTLKNIAASGFMASHLVMLLNWNASSVLSIAAQDVHMTLNRALPELASHDSWTPVAANTALVSLHNTILSGPLTRITLQRCHVAVSPPGGTQLPTGHAAATSGTLALVLAKLSHASNGALIILRESSITVPALSDTRSLRFDNGGVVSLGNTTLLASRPPPVVPSLLMEGSGFVVGHGAVVTHRNVSLFAVLPPYHANWSMASLKATNTRFSLTADDSFAASSSMIDRGAVTIGCSQFLAVDATSETWTPMLETSPNSLIQLEGCSATRTVTSTRTVSLTTSRSASHTRFPVVFSVTAEPDAPVPLFTNESSVGVNASCVQSTGAGCFDHSALATGECRVMETMIGSSDAVTKLGHLHNVTTHPVMFLDIAEVVMSIGGPPEGGPLNNESALDLQVTLRPWGANATREAFLRSAIAASGNNTTPRLFLLFSRFCADRAVAEIAPSQQSIVLSVEVELPPPPPPPKPLVPEAVMESAETTAVVGSTVAGAVGSPASATQASRAMFLLKLADCEPTFEPLDFVDHPLGFPLSDQKVKYHLGALVMNSAIIVGVAVLDLGVAVMYAFWRHKPVKKSIAWARFPSVLMLPLMFFVQPITTSAIACVAFGDVPTAVAGAVALLVELMGFILVVVYFKRGFRAHATYELDDPETFDQRSPFERFFSRDGTWRNNDRDRFDAVRHLGALFDDYSDRCAWFAVVELGVSAFFGFASAMTQVAGCPGIAYGAVALFFIYCGVVLWFKPHARRFDLYFTLLLGLLQGIVAGLIVIKLNVTDNEDLDGAINLATALSMFLMAIRGLYDSAITVKDLCVHRLGIGASKDRDRRDAQQMLLAHDAMLPADMEEMVPLPASPVAHIGTPSEDAHTQISAGTTPNATPPDAQIDYTVKVNMVGAMETHEEGAQPLLDMDLARARRRHPVTPPEDSPAQGIASPQAFSSAASPMASIPVSTDYLDELLDAAAGHAPQTEDVEDVLELLLAPPTDNTATLEAL